MSSYTLNQMPSIYLFILLLRKKPYINLLFAKNEFVLILSILKERNP